MKMPEGWKEVTLSEVAEVFNGKTPSEIEKRKEGHPILKIKDITEDGHFKGSFDSFVDSDFFNKYDDKIIKTGDTLILNAAHNAEYVGSKTFYVEDFPDGVISTGEWLIVRAQHSDLDKKFKHLLITSPLIRTKIKDKVKGIHLYPKDVRDIKILLPPLPTQQKIVSILGKAEQAKEWRKEADELTKEFLKSVFMEMFGDIKLQEFNNEMFEIIDGDRGVNYPHGNDFSDDGYCLFLNTGNVRKDGFNFDNLMFITKEKDEQLRKGKVSLNDVILTTRGTVGNVALFDQDIKFKHVRINSGMVLLRPNLKKITPRFLFSLIQMPIIQEQFKQANSGTAQPQLPIINLRRIKIPLPPLSLQQKFASIVKEVEAIKEQQKHSKEQIDNIFNALMQKAFKGELI